MKNYYFYLLIFLLFAACKKDKDETNPQFATLAGSYNIDGFYYHPDTAPEPSMAYDSIGVVRSIDLITVESEFTTYKMNGIGAWEDQPTNFFYFYVNNNNGDIVIPKVCSLAMPCSRKKIRQLNYQKLRF